MKLIFWLRERGTRQGVLALLLAAALALGGLLVLGGAGQASRSHQAGGALDRVSANGLVEGAGREIAVFPEVPGTLAAVDVRLHQEVAAGALLFELHNETQKAQVALAEAELASAEAKMQHAKTDWERSRDIRQSSPAAISAQAHDAARYQWQAAQAQVAEATARLRLARAELAKTQVKAIQAGQVLQIHGEPGSLVEVRKGSDPVLRMADVSRRRVRAWVEELDAARLALGQRATIRADGFPGREYAGTLVEIAGRMGRDSLRSDRPGERDDIYYREVVIDLEAAQELPLNLRVEVYIDDRSTRAR